MDNAMDTTLTATAMDTTAMDTTAMNGTAVPAVPFTEAMNVGGLDRNNGYNLYTYIYINDCSILFGGGE